MARAVLLYSLKYDLEAASLPNEVPPGRLLIRRLGAQRRKRSARRGGRRRIRAEAPRAGAHRLRRSRLQERRSLVAVIRKLRNFLALVTERAGVSSLRVGGGTHARRSARDAVSAMGE